MSEDWRLVILSELDYEHLVAELHYKDQFILLLDREDGHDSLCAAFPDKSGNLGPRILLEEFIAKLQAAAENLRR